MRRPGQGELGVETSELFGCRQLLDLPLCGEADIDRGLGGDELVRDLPGGAEPYPRTWPGAQRWTS